MPFCPTLALLNNYCKMSSYSILRSAVLIILLITGFTFPANSQSDTCMTALLVKKDKKLIVRNNMSTLNVHGFYLCREKVYDLKLVSGERFSSTLKDIKEDTLTFEYDGHKKLNLHPQSIEAIYFEIDASLGIYKKIAFSDYDISFKQGTVGCIPKPELSDTTYRKTFICFIPPMEIKVDEINGLALGFLAYPSNYRDFLKINGLCVETLTIGYFAPIFGSFLKSDYEALTDLEETRVIIKGATISIGGSVAEIEVSGFYLGGLATIVNKLNGFSITGIHTIAEETKGVTISGLRNQAARVKGVQIALFNSCTDDLAGVQIGLWNKNPRRTLPFINWGKKTSN